MFKKILVLAMVFSFVNCGGALLRPPDDYGDTKIDEKAPNLPMPNGSRYDCGVFIVYVNDSWGIETVFSKDQDLELTIQGLQFKVGLMLRGNHVVNETPRLLVNGDVYYTVKDDKNVYWAKVSLGKPVKEILLQSYATMKTCYADAFVSSVTKETVW